MAENNTQKKIQKLYFVGLLSHVDSSILNLKLKHNFEINRRNDTGFFSKLESTNDETTNKTLYFDYDVVAKDDYVYFVTKEYDLVKSDVEDTIYYLTKEEQDLIQNYLEIFLRLLRLFKEGNITMPKWYVFWYAEGKNTKPEGIISHGGQRTGCREILKLEETDFVLIEDFVKKFKLPFKKKFLNLAFRNFEESYLVNNELAFLLLIIALEALLSPTDNIELSYRIARNGAVLLGNSEEQCNEFFSKIREYHKKRSKMVHSGEYVQVSNFEIVELRGCVREIIKKTFDLDIDKNEFLELLHKSGFGSLKLV